MVQRGRKNIDCVVCLFLRNNTTCAIWTPPPVSSHISDHETSLAEEPQSLFEPLLREVLRVPDLEILENNNRTRVGLINKADSCRFGRTGRFLRFLLHPSLIRNFSAIERPALFNIGFTNCKNHIDWQLLFERSMTVLLPKHRC